MTRDRQDGGVGSGQLTHVAINHSPITRFMIEYLLDVGELQAEKLAVVNFRGFTIGRDVALQLSGARFPPRDPVEIANWIDRNLPFANHVLALVPQTREPFYCILAGAALAFDYIEDGIGHHEFLEGHFRCDWRRARLAVRWWRKVQNRWNTRYRLGKIAIAKTRSPGARRTLLRCLVRLPATFIDFSAARRIYSFRPYPHEKVRHLPFHKSPSLFRLRERLAPDSTRALLLLPHTSLEASAADRINDVLTQFGTKIVYAKRHPSSPTIGPDQLAWIRCDWVAALDESESQEEPAVLMMKRGIGVLIHFGSSAAIYAEMLRDDLGLGFRVVDLSRWTRG